MIPLLHKLDKYITYESRLIFFNYLIIFIQVAIQNYHKNKKLTETHKGHCEVQMIMYVKMLCE